MASFRGIGDDTQDVIKEQNRMAIASNELSQRSRESKDRLKLDRERLAASTAESGAKLQEDARQFDASQGARAREFDSSSKEGERQFDAKHQLALEEAQRNSERFSMVKKDWEVQDAKRQESLKLQEGAFADLVRASLFMPAAPDSFVRKANEAMGVDDKSPGAIRGTFQLRDANGFSQGVGYITVGADGKDVKNILTPQQVWQFMGKYAPEDQKMIAEEYGKAYNQNDPMNVARAKHMEAYAKYYEEGGAAGQRAPAAARPAAAPTTPQIEALRKEIMAAERELKAPGLTKTQRAAMEPRLGALRKRWDSSVLGVSESAPAGAPAESAASPENSPSVRVEGRSIIITENGVAKKLPDSPQLRDYLKAKGFNVP